MSRSRLMRFAATLLMLASAIPALAGQLERIQTAQELRVCIWPDYYGITYRNPITQELAGIDIDLAGELARDLGVKAVFIDSSFARLIDDITQDRCDIAMFAIGILPQRAEYMHFSSPYLQSDIFAITTRSNRRIKQWSDIDKPGVVVAVAQGTLHESVMKARLTTAKLLVLNTPHAREQEVESGRADVFMTDYPYSKRMLETTDWARLVAPPKRYHMTPYAYAMPKNDPAWHARVERFVHEIKQDGRLRKAASRHRLDTIVVDD